MGRTSDARERLVRTAIRSIFAQSYTSVSVDDLCAEAEVAKSSFYHFFPSKLDLALAALDHYWGSLQRRVLEPALKNTLPLREQLLGLVDLIYEGQVRVKAARGHLTGCLIGNLTLELSAYNEEVRMKAVALLNHWSARIEDALREGQRTGELPDIDPATAATAIVAYLEGLMLLAKSQNNPHVIHQLREGVLALAGLGAPMAIGS